MDLAKSLGADFVLKINPGEEDSTVIDNIKQLIGDQPSVSIDCTGADQSIRVAVQVSFVFVMKLTFLFVNFMRF